MNILIWNTLSSTLPTAPLETTSFIVLHMHLQTANHMPHAFLFELQEFNFIIAFMK